MSPDDVCPSCSLFLHVPGSVCVTSRIRQKWWCLHKRSCSFPPTCSFSLLEYTFGRKPAAMSWTPYGEATWCGTKAFSQQPREWAWKQILQPNPAFRWLYSSQELDSSLMRDPGSELPSQAAPRFLPDCIIYKHNSEQNFRSEKVKKKSWLSLHTHGFLNNWVREWIIVSGPWALG